jgi:Flp pilus assembly protein TadD
MAAAQGNLFANRNLPGEAEQAYRIAAELAPTELGPVSQLAGLLARAGRAAEAGQLLDTFAARNPGQSGKVDEKRSFLAIIPKR